MISVLYCATRIRNPMNEVECFATEALVRAYPHSLVLNEPYEVRNDLGKLLMIPDIYFQADNYSFPTFLEVTGASIQDPRYFVTDNLQSKYARKYRQKCTYQLLLAECPELAVVFWHGEIFGSAEQVVAALNIFYRLARGEIDTPVAQSMTDYVALSGELPQIRVLDWGALAAEVDRLL